MHAAARTRRFRREASRSRSLTDEVGASFAKGGRGVPTILSSQTVGRPRRPALRHPPSEARTIDGSRDWSSSLAENGRGTD